MFNEHETREMPGSPASQPSATGGPNPGLPQNGPAQAPATLSKARRAGSRTPIGQRIIDMRRQVFAPSRIQPPPDIALEYLDSRGKPAPRLGNEVEREFLDDVAAPGINRIRIGYTTNGRHDSPRSNHYRGLAADIDAINGKRVNTYNKDPEVKAWVDSIITRFRNRHDHEVYGPGAQLYKEGQPIVRPKLAKDHDDHIHWTRRR